MPKVITTEIVVCYVCDGATTLSKHGRSDIPCFACEDGTMAHKYNPYYPNMQVAIRHSDPFQNGAYTTMPTWYVKRTLARVWPQT